MSVSSKFKEKNVGKFPINGGFNQKFIYKWAILQRAMFDQRCRMYKLFHHQNMVLTIQITIEERYGEKKQV
jgi:hypothetical protein